MKAIPDLDFAARHINKPAVPPKPQITIPITSTTATSSANAAGTAVGTASAANAATTGPSSGSSSSVGGEQQPGKVQLAAQKLNNMEGAGSHRGSGEWSHGIRPAVGADIVVLKRCPPLAVDLNVARYRTEKPSKSPPPPPPRRSFPSAHGFGTNRGGDLMKNSKVRSCPVF